MASVRPMSISKGIETPNTFFSSNSEKVVTPESQKSRNDNDSVDEPVEVLEDMGMELNTGRSWRLRAAISAFLLVYTLFGAWVFQLLERGPELEALKTHRSALSIGKLKLLQTIQNLTDGFSAKQELAQNNSKWNATLSAVEEYEDLIDSILGGKLYITLNEVEHPHTLRWDSFSHAYFFVLTLITTIGYGNLAPTTTWGRIFCVNYALIGIPVMFIFIAQTGTLLARFSTTMYSKIFGNSVSLNYFTHQSDHSLVRKMIGTSASVLTVVALLFGYIAIGALLFDATESWGFISSFYFCFITLTTIGFGDLVPLPKPGGGHTVIVVVRTLYTLWGLAITATAIQLVQNHYAQIWLNVENSQSEEESENKDEERPKEPQINGTTSTVPGVIGNRVVTLVSAK